MSSVNYAPLSQDQSLSTVIVQGPPFNTCTLLTKQTQTAFSDTGARGESGRHSNPAKFTSAADARRRNPRAVKERGGTLPATEAEHWPRQSSPPQHPNTTTTWSRATDGEAAGGRPAMPRRFTFWTLAAAAAAAHELTLNVGWRARGRRLDAPSSTARPPATRSRPDDAPPNMCWPQPHPFRLLCERLQIRTLCLCLQKLPKTWSSMLMLVCVSGNCPLAQTKAITEVKMSQDIACCCAAARSARLC